MNAPEIDSFAPETIAQNESKIITVYLDWGEDEAGDELPMTVALYDTPAWSVAYTFTAADPVETPDPPEFAGEYTLHRVPSNPDYTTILQVYVFGACFVADHEYKWRVSEDDAGFECRSSLKKPEAMFSVTGPV